MNSSLTAMPDQYDGGFIALKGYCYQFDKTIADIFDHQKAEIHVEQIQDLDYDDYVIQIKHHDTKYSSAQIRGKKKKPIIQLLDLYQADPSKHYVLYMHLKDVAPGTQKLTAAELDKILGKDATNYTDAVKDGFLKKFVLLYAQDFVTLHKNVMTKIKSTFSCVEEETRFWYAVISSHLLRIVIDNPPARRHLRKTSFTEIFQKVKKGRQIIFLNSYSHLLSKEKYHKYLRKHFFSTSLNMSPNERFFLVEVNATDTVASMVETVVSIKAKWHKSGKRVDKPFAPYICFRNSTPQQLKEVKRQLVADNYLVKDGYDYHDADFNVSRLVEKLSLENKIQFRIINNLSEFKEAIGVITKTKELYQFYSTNPERFSYDFKHIQVQIEELADIKSIV